MIHHYIPGRVQTVHRVSSFRRLINVMSADCEDYCKILQDLIGGVKRASPNPIQIFRSWISNDFWIRFFEEG